MTYYNGTQKVEAIQVTTSNAEELRKFTGGGVMMKNDIPCYSFINGTHYQECPIDWYIVKLGEYRYTICSQDVFKQNFKELDYINFRKELSELVYRFGFVEKQGKASRIADKLFSHLLKLLNSNKEII